MSRVAIVLAATLALSVGAVSCSSDPSKSVAPPDIEVPETTTTQPPPPDTIARVLFLSSGGTAAVAIGDEIRLLTVARNASGANVSAHRVRWSSSDTTIAKVIVNGGIVGINRGTATITARLDSAQATLDVRVTIAALIGGDSATLAIGEQYPVGIRAIDKFGRVLPDQPIEWRSTRPEIASVDSLGVVTAIQSGQGAHIAYTSVVASIDGYARTVGVGVAPYLAGTPATLRLIHAAGGLGTIDFKNGDTVLATMAHGEAREILIATGSLRLTVPAFPRGQYTIDQSFNGLVTPAPRLTVFAVAGTPQAFLVTDWDFPVVVAANVARIRIVWASSYFPTYWGSEMHRVAPGAPFVTPPGGSGGIEWLGILPYETVAAAPFDFALIDSFRQTEFARFRGITPAPGKSTTYVVTGETLNTLKLLTIIDP